MFVELSSLHCPITFSNVLTLDFVAPVPVRSCTPIDSSVFSPGLHSPCVTHERNTKWMLLEWSWNTSSCKTIKIWGHHWKLIPNCIGSCHGQILRGYPGVQQHYTCRATWTIFTDTLSYFMSSCGKWVRSLIQSLISKGSKYIRNQKIGVYPSKLMHTKRN